MNVRRLISTIIAIVFVIILVIPSVTPSSTFAEFERIAENTSQIAMSLQRWGTALQKYARELVTFADNKIRYLRQTGEPAMPCQTEELTVSSATITSTTISSIKPVATNGAAFNESGKSIEGETCVACSRDGVSATHAGDSFNRALGAEIKMSCPCSNNGSSSNGSVGMANPAAMYCREMGYEYKVLKTKDGEKGICVFPDGSECDAWAFYRGEEKKEFSYCAKNGWTVAPEGEADAFAKRCTTCVLPDGSQKTVNKLLKLDEKLVGKTAVREEQQAPIQTQAAPAASLPENVSLPEHFDWRDNGGDWMTPVKDQGGCGSCWAFSAVGTVEPQYNISTGNPDLDLDLSEQYLVSDCYPSGNCGGGWTSTALAFIRDSGITDEACFPYTASNGPCSGRCSDWSDRLKTIDETAYVPGDVATIRQNLIDKGPLSVAMGIGSNYGGYFDGDIYRCTNDSGANHAVVITGYDESENYWIVKNSWGSTWNGNGYFKVGCSECSIENDVYYARQGSAVINPPTVTNASGATLVTSTSARLNGEVTSTGGENPTVHVCWGDDDGGTGTWDHDENLGIKGTQTFYKDISDLSYGTKYYYRCYATNSSNSDWADSTSSFTAGQQKLIGTDSDAALSVWGSNHFVLSKFTADATGPISQIKIRCGGNVNVKVAIYSDSSGVPDSLLHATDTSTACIPGWNTISITETSVTSGTTYWLAFNSDASVIQAGNPGSGYTSYYMPATYSSFSFPSSAGTAFTIQNNWDPLIAGWGTTPPPVLSVTTVGATSGDTIATLTGNLTNLGLESSAALTFDWGTSTAYGNSAPGTPPSRTAPGTFNANLTGLTNGQTYHFIAKATGNTNTIATDSDMTFTPSAPPQKLIGTDSDAALSVWGSNHFVLSKFTADATGTINQIKIRCGGNVNVKVAIYYDSSGQPGSLFHATDTSTACIPGWNTISITETSVTSGTTYWLAFNSDASVVQAGNPGSGYTSYYIPATYSSFSFPSSAGTSFTIQNNWDSLIAGWGTPTPPELTAETNAATAVGDGTATLNGTLVQLGTDTSAVVSFDYGTDTSYGSTVTADQSPMSAAGTFSYTLTSLTNDQEYHFRAKAVGSPSTETKYGSDMTFTPSAPPQKLIGTDSDAAPAVWGSNHFILSKFTADATGTINQIKIRCGGNVNVKVAIYYDSSGVPDSLLHATDTSTACIPGWNTISITETSVTSGTTYWLAFNSDASVVQAGNPGSGYTSYYIPATYSSFSFPSSAGTSFTIQNNWDSLIAGWGVSVPPTPPDAPTLVSPGTAITFKWNASTGATKYHLQVNTQSDFLGTNVVNEEVGDVTSYEVTGLSNGTTYYWRVKAGNDGGWSDWSQWWSVVVEEDTI